MSDTSKKINIVLIIVIAVLCGIIALLLSKGSDKKDDTIAHEGKENIFEIKCDLNCECDCKKDNDDNIEENNTSSNSSNNKTTNSTNNDTQLDIKILDNNRTWEDSEELDIFSDSEYVVKGKIAPESTGSYQFTIKNSSNYNIKYSVGFNETNTYGINMKYKLKKNDEYIIGDWVTYSQISQTDILLNKNSNDSYYLEWKWFGGSNDNAIGKDINSKYGLSIEIKATQVNG